MTLKRSISQRFKNTVEKTKRIVSSPTVRSFSSTHSPSPTQFSNTDDVSIHSAPIIRNSPLLINSESVDNTPTLLYSSKLRPSSIRRHSSQQKQLLDFIDTSLPPATATTISSTPTQLPTPIKTPTIHDTSIATAETTFDSSISDNFSSNVNNNNNNTNNNTNNTNILLPNDHPLLLPTDPIDKSIPPFTPDQLTPILLSSSLDNSFDKPSISHINSSTSCTATESSTNTTDFSSSPILIVQAHANPLFTKAHQIDHLDKNLDIRKNDQLADQMALNILHDISEENIDELSKLRDEINLVL